MKYVDYIYKDGGKFNDGFSDSEDYVMRRTADGEWSAVYSDQTIPHGQGPDYDNYVKLGFWVQCGSGVNEG